MEMDANLTFSCNYERFELYHSRDVPYLVLQQVTRTRLMVFLVAYALFSSFYLPSVIASTDEEDVQNQNDDDESKDDDEKRHSGEHQVNIDASGDEVKIELVRETEAFQSKIDVRFDTSKARIELKFEEEIGNIETEQKMDMQFQQIFEYNDSNNNGIYDTEEEVLATWELHNNAETISDSLTPGEATWTEPTISSINSNNVSGWEITTQAQLGQNQGTFNINLYIFGQHANLSGYKLGPTDVKIDLEYHSIPTQSNNSAIGLLFEVKSEQEINIEDDDGEAGFYSEGRSGGVGVNLSFCWLEYASVDGINQSIGMTILESNTVDDNSEFSFERLAVFSYPAGVEIIHDPTISVEYGVLIDSSSGITDIPGNNETWYLSLNSTSAIILGVLLPLFLLAIGVILRGGIIKNEDLDIKEPLLPWLLPMPPIRINVSQLDSQKEVGP